MKTTFRIPVNMLCDRNPQDARISKEAMLEKLGCTGKGLSLGGEGKHPEPSANFFIRYDPNNRGVFMGYKFELIEVDGFKETVIDKGSASGFTHHFEGRGYTKFSIKGEKLGTFNAYVPLVNELTMQED